MANRKGSGQKSAAKTPELVPQPHGGALLSGGLPGNPGGGRPKDEFKSRMRELATRQETEAQLITILSDSKHPHFLKALQYATEHGYGRATEHVEHSGAVVQYVVETPSKFTDRGSWQRQYSQN
jgi:hypothetical protein